MSEPQVAYKKIMLNGTSLTIAVTSEAKALGLDRGDYVKVTLERIEDWEQRVNL